jgi:peptidoglycan hydrolase-like protein with peptidoglycan-binding domain
MSQTEDTLVAPARVQLSRRTLVGLAALAAVIIALVVAYATGAFGGGGKVANGVVDNAFPTGTASVTRQSLESQTQVSGTLTYSGSSSVVAAAGTAPSVVLQAQQAVTTAQGMVQADNTTLAADSATVVQARASLAAARAKQSVDCQGANAAESASSGAAGGSAGAGPCASDQQTVSSDQQSLTSDVSKVAADRTQVASAQTALASAQQSLAAAESSAAVYGQSSTYTTLPAVGLVVRRGQSLYAISDQPVVLLYGGVAPWRAFVAGMSPGQDVAELNANLAALGYGKGLSGNVFTSSTAAAIEAFQSAHGLSPTGALLLGSVVFEPGAARVTAVTPTLGATVQPGPVLTITLTARQVQIALDAALQSDVKVGDPVSITLPNNQTTPGRVSYVGTVATTPSSGGDQGGGSSTPTIEVDVTPTDPAATGHLDQAPVNVSITTASVNNVLVVPVDALLALGSGGYALEEIGAGGVHHLVGVTVGLFDDSQGLVQVSGADLAAGQRVVTPGE